MALLRADPPPDEILVENIKMLRNAEASGQYPKVYGMPNDAH